MRQNLTVDELFESIDLQMLLGVPITLKQFVYMNLNEIAIMFNASAIFSPDYNVKTFFGMNLVQVIEVLNTKVLESPINLSEATLADLFNLFNVTFLMDPSFSIKTISNMNLLQLTELLKNFLPVELSELGTTTVGQVLSQFNMSFFLNVDINTLNNMTISQLVGQVQMDLLGLFNSSMTVSDLQMVSLADALGYLNISSLFFDPSLNANNIANMSIVELFAGFNSSLSDVFQLIHPANISQLAEMKVIDFVKSIDLSVIGLPLNVGNLLQMKVSELFGMANTSSLFELMDTTSTPLIQLNMILTRAFGLNGTDFGQMTLQQFLELANISFVLDPSLSVNNFINMPVIELADQIALDLIKISVSDLLQLPLYQVLSMVNGTFLFDPQFSAANFEGLTLMQVAQVIDTVLFQANFNFSILDWKVSGIVNAASMKLIDIFALFIPTEWKTVTIFDMFNALIGPNFSDSFFFDSSLKIQNILNVKLVDLETMLGVKRGVERVIGVVKTLAGFFSYDFDALEFLQTTQLSSPLMFVWSLFTPGGMTAAHENYSNILNEYAYLRNQSYYLNTAEFNLTKELYDMANVYFEQDSFIGMLINYQLEGLMKKPEFYGQVSLFDQYIAYNMNKTDISLFELSEMFNKTSETLSVINDFQLFASDLLSAVSSDSYLMSIVSNLANISENATLGDFIVFFDPNNTIVNYIDYLQSNSDQNLFQASLYNNTNFMFMNITINDILASQNMSQSIQMINDSNNFISELINLFNISMASYIGPANNSVVNLLASNPDLTIGDVLSYFIDQQDFGMLNANDSLSILSYIQSNSNSTIVQLLSHFGIDLNAELMLPLGHFISGNLTETIQLLSNFQSNPNVTLNDLLSDPQILAYVNMSIDTVLTMLEPLQQTQNMTIEELLDSLFPDLTSYKQMILIDFLSMATNSTADQLMQMFSLYSEINTLNDVLDLFNMTEMVQIVASLQSIPNISLSDLAFSFLGKTDYEAVIMYSQMTLGDLIQMANLTDIVQMISSIQANPEITVFALVASLSPELNYLSQMTLLNVFEAFNASEFLIQLGDLQANAAVIKLMDLVKVLAGDQWQIYADLQISDIVSMLNLTEYFNPLIFIQDNPELTLIDVLRLNGIQWIGSDLSLIELFNMTELYSQVTTLTVGDIVDKYLSPDVIPFLDSLKNVKDFNVSYILAMNNLSNIHTSDLLQITLQDFLYSLSSKDVRLDYEVYYILMSLVELSNMTVKEAIVQTIVSYEQNGMIFALAGLVVNPETTVMEVVKYLGLEDKAIFVFSIYNSIVTSDLNDFVSMELYAFVSPAFYNFDLKDLIYKPIGELLVRLGILSPENIFTLVEMFDIVSDLSSMFYGNDSTEFMNTYEPMQYVNVSVVQILDEWELDELNIMLQSIDLKDYSLQSILSNVFFLIYKVPLFRPFYR